MTKRSSLPTRATPARPPGSPKWQVVATSSRATHRCLRLQHRNWQIGGEAPRASRTLPRVCEALLSRSCGALLCALGSRRRRGDRGRLPETGRLHRPFVRNRDGRHVTTEGGRTCRVITHWLDSQQTTGADRSFPGRKASSSRAVCRWSTVLDGLSASIAG
jgi:hypothetical protein